MDMSEKKGWVPVHPDREPDWEAFTFDEEESERELAPNWQWKSCTVKVNE